MKLCSACLPLIPNAKACDILTSLLTRQTYKQINTPSVIQKGWVGGPLHLPPLGFCSALSLCTTYPLGLQLLCCFSLLKLLVILEICASWSGLMLRKPVSCGLGLGLAKVVGFSSFKLLKLLISPDKSANC